MLRLLSIFSVSMTLATAYQGPPPDGFWDIGPNIGQVLVQYVGEDSENLQTIMHGHGYVNFTEFEALSNFYIFAYDDDTDEQTVGGLQLQDSNVVFIRELDKLRRTLRSSNSSFEVNDQYYITQWNLRATSPANPPPMNVLKVWQRNYTGRNIVIAVVDNGIDSSHIDLTANYNSSLSYNYLDETADIDNLTDSHGTKCAGVIAAAKNSHCILGVAFEATIADVKFIDDVTQSSPVTEAVSLVHRLDVVDIYSCSWGPEDSGGNIGDHQKLHEVHNAAFLKGITEGRNGKGSIYVWAAGNGHQNQDDCNLDGFVSSPYTIAVMSLKNDGTRDSNAESCAMIMASVYASPVPTLSTDDRCSFDFEGSSAAATTAAGIIALVLEANGNLTWRDVQYLIVETAVPVNDLADESFQNGAGKWVSSIYGFGIMDAEAMVDAALTWNTVEPLVTHFEPLVTTELNTNGLVSLVTTHTVTDCPVRSLENVVIYLDMEAYWREYTSIYLISPFKTKSRLLRERKKDFYYTPFTWYFSSLAFWGEDPNGVWTLTINSTNTQNILYLTAFEMAFSGTTVQGVFSTLSPGITPQRHEITETDTPIIVGASIGAALGFILLLASCICIIRTVVDQVTRDTVKTIHVQEASPPPYSE